MTFDTVWTHHGAALKAFIYSRLSNPADAEDVLQEVAIKAHENLGLLEKPERVKSWLFQIANRAVIDQYRQNGKELKVHPDDLWYGEDGDELDAELGACVGQVIETLPADVSQLLADVELKGMSQKAYAENLGVQYSTLKSRVKKGREQLRHRFDQCCTFDYDALGSIIDFQPKTDCCT